MATTRELERSLFQSRPRELWHFYRGTEDWFYTPSKRAILFDGNSYLQLELTRGPIDIGGEDKPGAMSFTLPTDSALGQVLQEGSAPTPISLTIYRMQRDASDDPPIIFVGELSNADIEGEVITAQALPFTATLDITVPQGLYQKDQCQWNTYDPFTCKVDKATYTFSGTVAAISGLDITVTGASGFDPGTGTRADMFADGVLEFGERKGMIDTQTGDVIRLIERVPGLGIGSAVDLVAGDARDKETCHLKFANSARRLSFPNLPLLNPSYGQGLRL